MMFGRVIKVRIMLILVKKIHLEKSHPTMHKLRHIKYCIIIKKTIFLVITIFKDNDIIKKNKLLNIVKIKPTYSNGVNPSRQMYIG